MKGLASLCVLLTLLCHSLSAQTTITIGPGANWTDVMLYNLNTVNYSTYAHLNAHAWTNSSNQFMRTLLRFNLSGIPAGSTIQSASLYLYSDPNSSGALSNSQMSGSNAVFFEKVTGNWAETTVNWANQPATTTAGRVWQGPSASTNENIQVNLTSLVQEWVSSPTTNYGMKMRLENEVYYRARNYASEDHTNTALRPKLVVTYSTPSAFISNAPAGSFHRAADSLLQHLNKTGVSTGILYDRVMPLSSLHAFNSLQPDTSTSTHFLQAYREMYRAAYSNSSWLTSKDIRNLAIQSNIQKKVPVGLANFQFNFIDTSAIDQGLIQERDGMYYDVPNRPRHPFLMKSTFLASPLVDSVSGLTVTYELSSALTINKSSKSITSLQVDFGNGAGLVSMGLIGNFTITYPNPGWKTMKFVAGFSDGTGSTSCAIIKIKPDPLPLTGCDSGPVERIISDLSFQGYIDEAVASKGVGEYKIYYADSNCDKIIRKPIIVVDGFDPLDKEGPDLIYHNRLNVSKNGQPRLAQGLRAEGFDIIILSFPVYTIPNTNQLRDGGSDYIERNARVLMSLIGEVNKIKQGNEQLIILGPSMGGLISRYALAYMEQLKITHNTKLWVSFDSPHKGANIPLGDQHFLDFYAEAVDIDKAEENRDTKINSVAAKQMLVNHYLSLDTKNRKRHYSAPGGAPNFHQRFYNDLNALGFPDGDENQTNFRKIALVNGSLGGVDVDQPCAEALAADIKTVGKLLFLFKVRLITVSSSKVFYSPNNGNTCTVFDGWFSAVGRTFREVTLTTPPGSSGFDVAPGGTFNTQEVIRDEASGVVRKYGMTFQAMFSSLKTHHSFINTKSALAFSGANTNLSENLSNRNLVCTNETPFDSYFGPVTENKEHIDIWAEAGEWLMEWMTNPSNPPLPMVTSSTVTISGPDAFPCDNSSLYYSVPDLGPGISYSWAANPSLTIVSGNGTRQIEVKYNGGGGSNGSISLNIASTKCSYSVSPKTVTYGAPSSSPSISGPNVICEGGTWTAEVPLGATSIVWEYDRAAFDFYGGGFNTGYISLRFKPGYSSGWVNVKACNACGCAPYPTYMGVNRSSSACGGTFSYTYYPNPTSDELTVSYQLIEEGTGTAEAGNSTDTPSGDFEARLLNDKGKVLASGKNRKGEKVVLQTKGIADGTYFLHIVDGEEIIKKQIVIKH